MKTSHGFKKTYLLMLSLPVMLPAIAGCNETKSPGDVLAETFGNFMKGLIDVGMAFLLGH